MSTTAQVTVNLNGNSVGLSTALKGATRELLSFKNTLKAGFGLNIGAQLANGLLSLPGAFKAGIDSAVTFAGQINDLSRAAGLSSEAFQVLSRSAKLSGAEMADVSKAIVAVGEKAREAIGGERGAANAFARLGIDAKAFIQLAPERQMEALGQAYSNAGDKGAAFSALLEIMGTKQAPKLRAMLEELGDKGLGGMTAEMTKAGLLMRKDVADGLDEMGDKSEDLGTRFKNAWGDVAFALKPVFDVLHDFGMWIADVLSFIAISIEKIGIAAGTAGSIVADFMAGHFQGFAFYGDEAVRLWNDVDARRTAGLSGSSSNQTDTEKLSAGVKARDELQRIKEDIDYSQSEGAAQLATIARSFSRTNEEKASQTRILLMSQLTQLEETRERTDTLIRRLALSDPNFRKLKGPNGGFVKFERLRELGEGPAANKEIAAAFRQIDEINRLETGLNSQLGAADGVPQTISDGFAAAFTEIQNRWGTLSKQIASGVASIGDALTHGIGSSIEGLLTKTMSWADALRNIGGSVINGIISSLSRMAAEYIASELIIAGIKKMVGASNKKATKEETTDNAVSAGFKSIAQLGPIWGPLAFAASAAAIFAIANKGFFSGGFTGLGNPHEPAGIVHKGEFVMPHDVTAAIGPSALAGVVESVRSGSSAAITSPAFTSPGGGDDFPQLERHIWVDHRDQDMIDRLKGDRRFKNVIRHIGRQNQGDFGSPT